MLLVIYRRFVTIYAVRILRGGNLVCLNKKGVLAAFALETPSSYPLVLFHGRIETSINEGKLTSPNSSHAVFASAQRRADSSCLRSIDIVIPIVVAARRNVLQPDLVARGPSRQVIGMLSPVVIDDS